MAVANGMRSVANARPTLCDMLPNELDTDIPAKPRRSISRAVSSVARRRPGSAIRLRAGKAVGIGRCSFVPDVEADHSSLSSPRSLRQAPPADDPDLAPQRQDSAQRGSAWQPRNRIVENVCARYSAL